MTIQKKNSVTKNAAEKWMVRNLSSKQLAAVQENLKTTNCPTIP